MKKITLLIFILCNLISWSQVGIGTTSPTKTLDVDGDFRIRQTISTLNEPAAKDSILVVDQFGNMKRTTSKNVVNSYIKTAIKGQFSSASSVNLSLTLNKVKIPFNAIEIDVNSEFNTGSNSFIPKQDGLYMVKVQIKSDATVGITTNFGVAILKNNIIIAKNSYANVGVAGVNVTPPIRSIETLVQLNTGDELNFNIVSDLLSVTILGTSEDCFFTIQQIR